MGGKGLGRFAFQKTAGKAFGNGHPHTPLHGLVRDVYDRGFVDFASVRIVVLPDDFGDFGIAQFLQPHRAEGRVILFRAGKVVQQRGVVDKRRIQGDPLLVERGTDFIGQRSHCRTVGDQIRVSSGCFEQGETDVIILVWFK